MIDLITRITINSNVCHGKPTIRNKRYQVESMLELLASASGMSMEEILLDYEDLEKEDLLACILYAAKLSQTNGIYKVAS